MNRRNAEPGRKSAIQRLDAIAGIDEDRIDWKTHEHHVNRITGGNQQAFALCQFAGQHQAAEAGKKAVCHANALADDQTVSRISNSQHFHNFLLGNRCLGKFLHDLEQGRGADNYPDVREDEENQRQHHFNRCFGGFFLGALSTLVA